jgi:hypothetical protein
MKRPSRHRPKFCDLPGALSGAGVTATVVCVQPELKQLELPLNPEMSYDDLQRAKISLTAIVDALASPFFTEFEDSPRPLTRKEISTIEHAMQLVSQKVVDIATRLANTPKPRNYKFPALVYDYPGENWRLPKKPPSTPKRIREERINRRADKGLQILRDALKHQKPITD